VAAEEKFAEFQGAMPQTAERHQQQAIRFLSLVFDLLYAPNSKVKKKTQKIETGESR